MSTCPRGLSTASEESAKMVQQYAPLLRGGLPLPRYRQPDVRWEQTPACDAAFAQCMRDTWARLDLEDRTQFSEDECRVLRYQRLHGTVKLYLKVHHGPPGFLAQPGPQAGVLRLHADLANLIGDKLLSLLTPAHRERWFPWHDVSVRNGGTSRSFTLRLDSLVTHVTADGRPFYASAAQPLVTIQGKRRIVAFAPHAIMRIAERIAAPVVSYATQGDIFAYVNHYRYFEAAELHPRQAALTMYDECTKGYVSEWYADAILDQRASETTYAYRLGYGPVVEDGPFWLVTTILMPGFTGTPEYGVLLKASLAPGVKERMLAQCQELSYAQVARSQDFSLLRWFHTHGVPQVISCPPKLFDFGV